MPLARLWRRGRRSFTCQTSQGDVCARRSTALSTATAKGFASWFVGKNPDTEAKARRSVFSAIEGDAGFDRDHVPGGEDHEQHTDIDHKEQGNRRIRPDRRGTRWQNNRHLGHSFVGSDSGPMPAPYTEAVPLASAVSGIGGISSRQPAIPAETCHPTGRFCASTGNLLRCGNRHPTCGNEKGGPEHRAARIVSAGSVSSRRTSIRSSRSNRTSIPNSRRRG